MSEFLTGPTNLDLLFEYEAMIEDNNIDLSKYSWDDTTIPIDLLPEKKRSDEYIDNLYRRCIKEKKPWQEFEHVEYEVNDDIIY